MKAISLPWILISHNFPTTSASLWIHWLNWPFQKTAAGAHAGASLVRSRLGGETGSSQDFWGHGASAKLRSGISVKTARLYMILYVIMVSKCIKLVNKLVISGLKSLVWVQMNNTSDTSRSDLVDRCIFLKKCCNCCDDDHWEMMWGIGQLDTKTWDGSWWFLTSTCQHLQYIPYHAWFHTTVSCLNTHMCHGQKMDYIPILGDCHQSIFKGFWIKNMFGFSF